MGLCGPLHLNQHCPNFFIINNIHEYEKGQKNMGIKELMKNIIL